ncbi:hypothetical protein [Kribbella solani]|uniref:Uncharacterized protein n=1 Tax=Kribbella solani TaxID=236067 RepID=A0A841DE70_9ACTN|nr:hypothetical protein [Kribbella solani]MBB5977374.1 hypothetical protein [Kribbella solani]
MARRVQAAGAVEAADWVVAGVGEFGSGVGGLVPWGFEAYARVLHPASAVGGKPVTWAEVAEWSGGVVHPRVQFMALAARRWKGKGSRVPADTPWEEGPEVGSLPGARLSALGEVLARHTGTAERCWFCVWDGDEDRPRVELPNRSYLLLEGPLDAAGELARSLLPQSPNVFWPDDRAWCVATEIDLDSTYLGGTAELVAEVLADERLEAVRVEVTDPVWADSDELNR